MARRYEATHLIKDVVEDHYEQGELERMSCVMDEKVQIHAPTLKELIEKLAEHSGCPGDYVWAGSEEDGPVDFLEFSRQENEQGEEPYEHEKTAFKDGTLNLWNATYRYHVRCVETVPITHDDVKATGVQTD